MAVGEGGRGFKIADAFIEVHVDDAGAKREVRGLGRRVGPDADRAGQDVGRKIGDGTKKTLGPASDRAGRDSGGKLAKGMELAFVRNSPLIAAAVSGVLIAAAPAALTAASAIFGGIGIASAAQSTAVRSEWREAWDSIQADAFDASQPIENVLVGLADRVESRFHELQPVLSDAMVDIAPQLDSISESALNAAENALPGLFHAIDAGMPVTQGFGQFLERTGTGLSDFFDSIAEHAPAAGQVWGQLGTTVGTMLPILAEVIGQGVELASDVLPLLNSTLGVTLDVVEALGPALPAVAKGLAAFAIAKSIGGWLESGARALDNFTVRSGLAEQGSSRFASTAGRISGALPIVGLAVVGLTEAFTAQDQAVEELSGQMGGLWDIVRQGGNAGRDAQMVLQAMGQSDIPAVKEAFENAQRAAQQYEEQLSPLERAQQHLQAAEHDVADAVHDHGEKSLQAAEAQQRYRDASAEVERAQAELEQAIHGVTTAMIEQSDQALAAIDSSFAYQHAQNQLEDAQSKLADVTSHLNDANKDTRTSSEDVQRAQLDLSEQVYRTAQAFGQQQADLSGASADSAEYARIVQEQTLAALIRLRDTAGPEVGASIDQMIGRLQASGITLGNTSVSAQNVSQQFADMRLKILDVPNSKTVIVSSTTPQQIQLLQDLGFEVRTLPNGTIQVTARTQDAENALNYTARDRSTTIFAGIKVSGSIPLGADGGSVEDLYAMADRYDVGGAVRGRGGPRDDLVPAVGPGGRPARLANGEHVLDGTDVNLMGGQAGVYRFRELLNRGEVDVPAIIRAAQRGDGATGPVGSSGSGSITVQNLNVRVQAIVQAGREKEFARQLAPAVRDALVELERSYR